MPNLMSIFGFGFGFASVAAAIQIPMFSSHPPTSSIHDRIDHVLPALEDIIEIGGTAGVSIGVMAKGQVLIERHFGYADVEAHKRADSGTRYPLGSLTKAFVATTVAKLVDDGLLKWDEPITTYIPGLSLKSDDTLAHRLTLIDLLSHRTGLARLDPLWLGANGEVNLPKESLIDMCNNLFPVQPLRSGWLYNNWMYALAGKVIEEAKKCSFGTVLASHVLDKLELKNTSLISSSIPSGSTAHPYLVLDDKTLVRSPDLGMTDEDIMSSAGGVRSTIPDMLTWGNALLSPFRNDGPLNYIDAVMYGHSFMNQSFKSDEAYGLGFAKVDLPAQLGKIGFNPGLVEKGMPVLSPGLAHQVFYHNGAITGYNNCFMLIPELDAVIIVLTNSISQSDVADWIAQTLLQAVIDSPSPVDMRGLARQAAAKWRAQYRTIVDTLEDARTPHTQEPKRCGLVGKYWHSTRALYLEVFEDDKVLSFSINGKPSQSHVLSHYNYDTYIFLPSADDRIRRGLFHYGVQSWLLHFKKNADGRFDSLVWNIDAKAIEGEVFTKDPQ
ncbi:hypothetical protein FAUST_10973 [Fusarium austroamericanum]|uniref:Beta-lactamase-related domain-containing protein n=1 Tax=Fusarium austroamericanum TaxID=282268 RepID=A0AAN6BUR7_FUSAU|nr:hypothetical protein FAUST_10973 [Fusarium austroamericanum]